jgi:hypothetical protein
VTPWRRWSSPAGSAGDVSRRRRGPRAGTVTTCRDVSAHRSRSAVTCSPRARRAPRSSAGRVRTSFLRQSLLGAGLLARRAGDVTVHDVRYAESANGARCPGLGRPRLPYLVDRLPSAAMYVHDAPGSVAAERIPAEETYTPESVRVRPLTANSHTTTHPRRLVDRRAERPCPRSRGRRP